MIRTIVPSPLCGEVTVPSSKSQAHRLLIAAALGKQPVSLRLCGLNDDIEATASCLNALGAEIQKTDYGYYVNPIKVVPTSLCRLSCRESGSTLRFLLPLCGVLGANAVFVREGRLSRRPLAPLDALLMQNGMQLREDGELLYCSGRLKGGSYLLPGNVSSQFLTGLLLALPLAEQDSTVALTTQLQSSDYVRMTQSVLHSANIRFSRESGCWSIPAGQQYALPGVCTVEGDWSSAAAFLCAGAISKGITVHGLDPDSEQPDRAVLSLLQSIGADIRFENGSASVKRGNLEPLSADCSQFPDLVPVLCAVAAFCRGESRFTNCARLRIKESDRLHAIAEALTALGGDVTEYEDSLTIRGKPSLAGGSCESFGDHRIAMLCAVASVGCQDRVVLDGAECVCKSYPDFWLDFGKLQGGSV